MKPFFLQCKSDDIVFTCWYLKDAFKKESPRIGIMCYGLPSHPYQHSPAKLEFLMQQGWMLVYPSYRGSYASEGKFTWEGCVDTILKVITIIHGGKVTSVEGRSLEFTKPSIVLMGGSFGGSVALVAGAKSKLIQNIVSISAPTDWRDHAKLKDEDGEPFDELYGWICHGWGSLWRIPSRKEWDRLTSGSADLNPILHLDELRSKNVFIVHGTGDNIVSPNRSKKLYEELKKGSGNHRLILLNEWHIDYNILSEEEVKKEFFAWLKKL